MLFQKTICFFYLIASNQDQFHVRAYNRDDTEIIFVNQHLLVTTTLDADSGFVNATGDFVNGLNNSTFIDNSDTGFHSWAFELKRNSQFSFSSTSGNPSKTSQNVRYNAVPVNVTICA